MSLYHKYRPQELSEMFGNESIVNTLHSTLTSADPPHAFLFHGPTGCGKTTLARITARELGVKGSDFREVDSADFRGIDTIRELRQNAQYKPMEGLRRAWLLDECHKLTNDAQNALLKALEDPPPHVYYLLATTEPNKLLPTIRGRCSEFQVAPLERKDMFRLIKQIVKAEDETITKPIYEQILQRSEGRPRNAIQILEQVLQAEEGYREEIAEHAGEVQAATIDLCRALIKNEPWGKVKGILDGLQKEDPESVRRAVMGYMKSVLLNTVNDQAGLVMEEFVHPFYNTGFPGLVFACYRVIRG